METTPAQVAQRLLAELRTHENADNVAGMARFGISSVGTLGASMPVVRALASSGKRELGRDKPAWHELAALLWASGIHEARIMAAIVDAPELVTVEQAEAWALDLDSWDTCDQLCGALLWRTGFAWELPARWSSRPETYVKRAGFVVVTQLAVKDKTAEDARFLPFLALVERECEDDRNDVKKGVNWALRQVGKRNAALNAHSVATAESILAHHADSRSARWIARDALRELRSDAIRARLGIA